MTEKLDLYKCETCGNIVEVVINGEGQLVCCGQEMQLLKEHTKEDEMLNEKHVPVISRVGDGVKVKVGSVPHPMTEEHYIMFIEAYSDNRRYVKRKYLYPNEEAYMKIKCDCERVTAREFCNIHGLWISEEEGLD